VSLLQNFESGQLDPATFSHRMHVEAALALIDQTDFLDAANRCQRAIRMLAERAGAPEKANVTITLAFLALIAERRASAPGAPWEEFLAANPDLLRKDVLAQWYAPQRLKAPLAQRSFLMPDRAP
jgi:hypothetical protein